MVYYLLYLFQPIIKFLITLLLLHAKNYTTLPPAVVSHHCVASESPLPKSQYFCQKNITVATVPAWVSLEAETNRACMHVFYCGMCSPTKMIPSEEPLRTSKLSAREWKRVVFIYQLPPQCPGLSQGTITLSPLQL